MTLVCKDEAGVEYSPLVKDLGKGFLRPYFTFAGDCASYVVQTGRSVQFYQEETACFHSDFYAAVAPKIEAIRAEQRRAYHSADPTILR